MSEVTKYYRQQNGLVVVQKGKLLSRVEEKETFTGTPPAIAWDRDLILFALRDGVTHVEVIVKNTQTTYTASIASMSANGILRTTTQGSLVLLALKYWRKEQTAAAAVEEAATQSTMFGTE